MSEIQVLARMKVHSGKMGEFRELARQCLQSVKSKDQGTLQYDWFLDEGSEECVVVERYRDSDAVLEHMANLGPVFQALLSITDFSLEVFGSPSEDLVAAAEGLDVRVYASMQGYRS